MEWQILKLREFLKAFISLLLFVICNVHKLYVNSAVAWDVPNKTNPTNMQTLYHLFVSFIEDGIGCLLCCSCHV